MLVVGVAALALTCSQYQSINQSITRCPWTWQQLKMVATAREMVEAVADMEVEEAAVEEPVRQECGEISEGGDHVRAMKGGFGDDNGATRRLTIAKSKKSTNRAAKNTRKDKELTKLQDEDEQTRARTQAVTYHQGSQHDADSMWL